MQVDLYYQGIPNIDQRLTNIVNDIGDQWNHGQAVWNAAKGDFWSEWVQGYYPWAILRTTTWTQIITDTMRQYWGVSTNYRSRTVLEILSSLESQLTGLSIDTTRMSLSRARLLVYTHSRVMNSMEAIGPIQLGYTFV